MSHLILLHKPLDVLCQFSDAQGRSTLADFVPMPGVYPAGRLDRDSEGLVLLTDDGSLQARLSHPAHKLPKTYWLQVEGEVSGAALTQLERGLLLDGRMTLPAKARRIDTPDLPARARPIRVRQHIPTSWLELVLYEGRNRQARRMAAQVGFPVLRLIRVAIGPMLLQGLPAGAWREASDAEHKALTAWFSQQGESHGLTNAHGAQTNDRTAARRPARRRARASAQRRRAQ